MFIKFWIQNNNREDEENRLSHPKKIKVNTSSLFRQKLRLDDELSWKRFGLFLFKRKSQFTLQEKEDRYELF